MEEKETLETEKRKDQKKRQQEESRERDRKTITSSDRGKEK